MKRPRATGFLCTSGRDNCYSSFNAFGGAFRLLACACDGCRSRLLRFGTQFAFIPDFAKLVVRQVLDANEGVVRSADADQFVQLDLDGCTIPVLRVLDQKHHQEGDDGRAGVDDQLPGVRIVKDGPGNGPDHHDRGSGQKSGCSPGGLRDRARDPAKKVGDGGRLLWRPRRRFLSRCAHCIEMRVQASSSEMGTARFAKPERVNRRTTSSGK
jgi:hypothetical protein